MTKDRLSLVCEITFYLVRSKSIKKIDFFTNQKKLDLCPTKKYNALTRLTSQNVLMLMKNLDSEI